MFEYLQIIKKLNVKIFNLIILIFLSLSSVIFELFGITIFIPIFQYIKYDGSLESLIESSSIWNYVNYLYSIIHIEVSLIVLLISAFILFALRQIFNYIRFTYRAVVLFNLNKLNRLSLLRRFFNSKFVFQKNYPKGELINLFTNEVNNAALGMLTPVEIVSFLLMFLGYTILLGFISLEFTIIALFILGISFLAPYNYLKKSYKVGYEITKFNSKIGQFLLTRFNSSLLIKLASNSVIENYKFDSLTEKQKNYSILSIILFNKTDLVIEPIIILTSLFFIYFSYTYFNFELELIGICLIIIIRLIPIFKALVKSTQNYRTFQGPINKVLDAYEKFDLNKEIDLGIEQKNELNNNISFNDISFEYEKNKTIFKKINFKIISGKLNAIVGPSGSGKSTILYLISKLITPKDGAILFDDKNYIKLKNSSIRSLISYCPQETTIFSNNVIEFISYGQKKINYNKIYEILKETACDKFINFENSDIDQIDPENLSYGQKKRLDICRILYSNKPIIIFDEPTANLDEYNKRIINNVIFNLSKKTNKTIIIIEHQLKNLSNFDNIIVLNNGIIEASGSHNELMNSNQWYRNANNLDS